MWGMNLLLKVRKENLIFTGRAAELATASLTTEWHQEAIHLAFKDSPLEIIALVANCFSFVTSVGEQC